MGRLDDLAADPDVSVPRQHLGEGVLVNHHLHVMPGLFPAGLYADDRGVPVIHHHEEGGPASVAVFPRSRKAFWPST